MTWRVLNFQSYNAFENMAIDEAVFRETIRSKKSPTLRFYSWRPAAVSIGYFQDINKEVNVEKCRTAGIDIVRRLSGGKAVFHCAEVTYSVIACNTEPFFPPDILGTYRVISNCLVQGLADLGIKASLAEIGRNTCDNDFRACCFSTPSRNELLVSGRKICGSAQMRSGGGFLQHGSILTAFDPVEAASFLLPPRTDRQLQKLKDSVAAINEEISRPVDEKEICASLIKGFNAVLGQETKEEALSVEEVELADRLMQKYANLNWNINGKQEPWQ